MHKWTHFALILAGLLLAMAAAPSCSSSSGGASGSGGGGGDVDGGITGQCDQCQFDIDCVDGLTCVGGVCEDQTNSANCGSGGAGGGGLGGGGGGDDGGEAGVLDGGPCTPGVQGYLQSLATPNGYRTSALAVNLVTNTLFAPLEDSAGANAGIAVFDTTTNALKTTIPPVVVDGGPVAPYFFSFLTAVDSTKNLFYATRGASTIVDVFNGATNAFVSSFDVAALDPSCSRTLGLRSIALDPGRQVLYTACPSSGLNVEITVLDVTGTVSASGSLSLNDLQSNVGGLALDPTNQKLFVVNGVPGYAQTPQPPLLVDTIDTTSNTEVANSQLDLGPANVVAFLGGYPTMIATPILPDGGPPDGGDAGPTVASFIALEGVGSGFGATFVPTSFEPGTASDPPGIYWAFGYDTNNGAGPFAAITGVETRTDGGPPEVLSETDFPLPKDAGLLLAQSFVSGNLYSYLSGISQGPSDGGSGSFSYVVCAP